MLAEMPDDKESLPPPYEIAFSPPLANNESVFSSGTLSLTMKISPWAADYIFTRDSTSSTLFTVTRKPMSQQHQMTLMNSDARPLFEITKDPKRRIYSYTFCYFSTGQ